MGPPLQTRLRPVESTSSKSTRGVTRCRSLRQPGAELVRLGADPEDHERTAHFGEWELYANFSVGGGR